MGRHETFKNATPLVDDLLAGTGLGRTQGADPVFAAIHEHRAAWTSWLPHLDAISDISSRSPAYAEAERAGEESRIRDEEAFAALIQSRPTTLNGLLALAAYLPGAIARNGRDAPTDDGVMGLAAVCDALLALVDGSTPAADASTQGWAAFAAIHPGMVPYPAAAPRCLMAVNLAIRAEAGRLLDVAESEFDRLYAEQSVGLDDEERDAVAERLRCDLRIRALEEAANDADPRPPVDWHSAPDGFIAHAAIEPERGVFAPEGHTPSASPALTEMVEAWHALAVEIEDENVTDEEAEALSDRHTELQIAICRFPAASMADLLAKVPVFRNEMRDATDGLNPDFRPEDTLSGAAWLGLFRDFERLAAAVSPQRAEPAGDDLSQPGLILFEDTTGRTRRKPVAEWVAYMAQHLYHVARNEEARAFNAACNDEPDQDANELYDRFRRDLRVDALHDLAFRSREVFEASRGYVVGGRWRYAAGPDGGQNGTLVRDMLAGWSAWADLDRPDWSGDRAKAEALVMRRDALIAAAERLPPTLASLSAKALALAWIEYAALWEAGRAREDYEWDGRLAVDIHKAAATSEADAPYPDAAVITPGLELNASDASERASDAGVPDAQINVEA